MPEWSEGLFGISPEGDALVYPLGPAERPLVLSQLVSLARDQHSASLPLLLTFPQLAHTRAAQLQNAFQTQIDGQGYAGRYTPVYPIKVNQHQSLVQELTTGSGLGVETGSKAELLAALAVSAPNDLIICNGYKDSDYLQLALLGQRLGRRVTIVLESLDELPVLVRLCRETGQTPTLGVRLKLASVAGGHWQNSGGERSKFGLGPAQIDRLLEMLALDALGHWLQMVHFHMGSQISNIRDIQEALDELGRYLTELHHRGIRISQVDVGGGLGVDYEGAASREFFSMNYRMDHYAAAVVSGIARACDAAGLVHPDIITEAGRALSAHHAVLVSEVIRSEQPPSLDDDPAKPDAGTERGTPARGSEFADGVQQLLVDAAEGPPSERFSEAQHLFAAGKAAFAAGAMSLAERARLDRTFYALCRDVVKQLDPHSRRTRGLADELATLLAQRCFCNLSVFRSMPDAWAIGQVFPIMPLTGLHEAPTHPSVLHDLTCDSDGQISRYVTESGIEPTLPLPDFSRREERQVAVFLVGAYQDILGDNHNLLGRTQLCEVRSENGLPELTLRSRGDSTADVLREVGYQRHWLEERFASLAGDDPAAADLLHDSLDSYTYLRDSN